MLVISVTWAQRSEEAQYVADGGEGRAIGPADVEAVAELARIALAPGEAERLARDLGRILAAAETLGQLDLEGVDSAYRPSAEGAEQAWWPEAIEAARAGRRPSLGVAPGAFEARLRPDAPEAGLAREAALGAAPARDEAFFRVPTVVERT